MISLIVAMAKNRVIGKKNQLPWHLPADLKYFRSITWGKPIIMGRITFESIGQALPGRKNIVISSDPNFHAQNIQVTHSLDKAIQLAETADEIMIIGGAKIFAEALPKANRIYLTLIEADIPGDVYFPKLDDNAWIEISHKRFLADEKNVYDYSFIILERLEIKSTSMKIPQTKLQY